MLRDFNQLQGRTTSTSFDQHDIDSCSKTRSYCLLNIVQHGRDCWQNITAALSQCCTQEISVSGQLADRMGTCRRVSDSEMLKSSARSDSRELRRLWCGAAGCCDRAAGTGGPAGALRLKASVCGSVGDFLLMAVCCRQCAQHVSIAASPAA